MAKRESDQSDSDTDVTQIDNKEQIGQCSICYNIITGKIMICPKGCAPFLCEPCIDQM